MQTANAGAAQNYHMRGCGVPRFLGEVFGLPGGHR